MKPLTYAGEEQVLGRCQWGGAPWAGTGAGSRRDPSPRGSAASEGLPAPRARCPGVGAVTPSALLNLSSEPPACSGVPPTPVTRPCLFGMRS